MLQRFLSSKSALHDRTRAAKPGVAQNLEIILGSGVVRQPDLAGTAAQTEDVAGTKDDPDTVLIRRALPPRFRHQLLVTVPRIRVVTVKSGIQRRLDGAN